MQIEAAVARKEFSPLNFETLDLEEPRHNEVQAVALSFYVKLELRAITPPISATGSR